MYYSLNVIYDNIEQYYVTRKLSLGERTQAGKDSLQLGWRWGWSQESSEEVAEDALTDVLEQGSQTRIDPRATFQRKNPPCAEFVRENAYTDRKLLEKL